MGIKADDFETTSGNFTNVEFVIVDGDLVITPASVAVVKIAGNTKTVTYNGEEQSGEGYTVTSNPANADETLVGKAVAACTDADTYPMGVESGQEAGPRRATAPRIVELREPQAFSRQPVQYGCFDFASEASRIGKTEVVGKDDDDVGRRLRG